MNDFSYTTMQLKEAARLRQLYQYTRMNALDIDEERRVWYLEILPALKEVGLTEDVILINNAVFKLYFKRAK